MTALALYRPLAPELRAEMDRLIAGPVRLAGAGGDADLVLPLEPALYHPDAQREADARRAALAQPADPQVIRLWAETLAAGHGNAPDTQSALTTWLSALIFTCGDDLPGAVWDAVALRRAIRTFGRYWPNAGEVFELLAARAAQLRQEITALDAIAKGELVRRGPAREAFGYQPPPAPPQKPAHPSRDDDPSAALVRIDPAAVARQLAELGVDDPGVDLLAARRQPEGGAERDAG